jgi:DNA repair protein RecO (recombination protein O)
MFIHYRTLGLVLKKEDRGETDQLISFYTKDFGKLEILGKAIRKISSKLRSGTNVFYLSEIEFIQGRAHKTLTDAVLVDKFKNLRKDLKKSAVAYKIAEILDDLIKGQEKDEKIWRLVLETFHKLDDLTLLPVNYFLIYYYFLWNLFSVLGYRPEIYKCSFCQKKLEPNKIYFSIEEGALICSQCSKKTKGVITVNEGLVKILRIILKKDWLTFKRLKIENYQKKALKEISENYLNFVAEQSK